MGVSSTVPLGKGKRLIVCHVGSASLGFVKELRIFVKWGFRSNTSKHGLPRQEELHIINYLKNGH